MRTARFDSNDHAVTEGWATYHKDLKGRLALPACGISSRDLYYVAPVGPLAPDPDCHAPDESFEVRRALVLARLLISDEERQLWLGRFR